MTLLVGSNNSGKSRFLRTKLKKIHINYNSAEKTSNEKINKIEEKIKKLKKDKSNVINKYDIGYHQINSLIRINLDALISVLKEKKLFKLLEGIQEIKENPCSDTYLKEIQTLNSDVKNIKEEEKLKRLYIPILRGLRTFEESTNHYGERTQKDYFDDNKGVEIFTGLELYSKLQDMLLGEYEEREKVREYEEFLSENFFENKKISLIPKKKDDVVHIKIGKEEDFPIYELGDGIQMIIILTFPLFEKKGEDILIGIEEPEICLHPGLQRKLMEVLIDSENKYGFENFQYLITTHSNHFLDLTLEYPEDVIIHESRKVEDGKFELIKKNDENMLELMENLGVRNSSVFLANSTIWVEGITDRIYLKKYLEVYQNYMFANEKIGKIYEEDKHYSFLEYSGGNITHWDFLDEEEGMTTSKISNKVFLLADTDGYRGKTKKNGELSEKAKRIEKLEGLTKITTYLLECREIENLITPKVIKEILKEKGESEIEKLEFSQNGYKDLGIGEYIENTLLKDKNKNSYKEKSGTIKDKVKFCRIACSHTNDYSDLSDETKRLCSEIYEFIKKAN